MGLRYWASLVALSVALHLAVFWPLPAPPADLGAANRLVVTLLEVPQVDLHALNSRHPEPQLESQVEIKRSRAKSKVVSTRTVELAEQVPTTKAAPGELQVVKSTQGKPRGKNDFPSGVSKNEANPSISRYRFALAAEVIRARALIESLVGPDFKGRLVVQVQLRGSAVTPHVSLDEAAGSEHLHREILAAFRKAVELVPVSIAGEVGDVSIRLPIHFDQAALD